MIRSQRSPYATSLLGAGAVHHIRLGHGGMSALSPFYPQLRTLLGVVGTAEKCPCVDGSGLARTFFTSQAWSVLPCVFGLEMRFT